MPPMQPLYRALIRPLSETIATVLPPHRFHELRHVSETVRGNAPSRPREKMCQHVDVDLAPDGAWCKKCGTVMELA